MKRKLIQQLAYFYANLFATPKLAGMHYALFRIGLRGLGVMNYYDRFVSGEEFFIRKLLPRLIRNSTPTFFDVGANRGEYSSSLSSQFYDARIFAFEPHPQNFEVLSKLNIRNFSAYPIALSSVSGQSLLYDYADADGSTKASLHKEVITDVHGKRSISHLIETETLDSFVLSLKIDTIDFLKIDTEGSELAILIGGQNLLKQKRIDVIQFEFNEMNVISHTFLYDFRKLLEGYTLFRLLPNGLLSIPDNPLTSELFGFQNVVAISGNKASIL